MKYKAYLYILIVLSFFSDFSLQSQASNRPIKRTHQPKEKNSYIKKKNQRRKNYFFAFFSIMVFLTIAASIINSDRFRPKYQKENKLKNKENDDPIEKKEEVKNNDINIPDSDDSNKTIDKIIDKTIGGIRYRRLTFASQNQYRAGGKAACLHFAANLAIYSLDNPNADLHNNKILDKCLKRAKENHGSDQADTYDNVAKRYQLEIDEGTDTPLLSNENAIVEELQKGISTEKINAILQNGIEAWFLKINKDGTIDIAESHTRTDIGIYKAYIMQFDSVEDATKYIVKYNPLVNGTIKESKLRDYQRQQQGVRVYWTNRKVDSI